MSINNRDPLYHTDECLGHPEEECECYFCDVCSMVYTLEDPCEFH